jgi:hypothetical protein
MLQILGCLPHPTGDNRKTGAHQFEQFCQTACTVDQRIPHRHKRDIGFCQRRRDVIRHQPATIIDEGSETGTLNQSQQLVLLAAFALADGNQAHIRATGGNPDQRRNDLTHIKFPEAGVEEEVEG